MKNVRAAVMLLAVGCAGAQQMPTGSEMHGGGAAFLTISPARAMELGDEDTQRFYDGDEIALWTEMSLPMQKAVQSEDVLKAFTKHMATYFGKETKVLHEDAVPAPPGAIMYRRIVMYEKAAYPMVVTFTFSGGGTIEEFHIREEPKAADSKYLDYHPKTKLLFPLQGEWTIYQGGRLVSENEHATSTTDRFAYDVVLLNVGQLYTKDGATNEEWYGFGQPVLATAPGTVVKVLAGSPDNAPYHPDPEGKRGNVVVIEHGNGEFSVYSRLKHESAAVKTGTRVKAGDKIAEVGNSGDSQFTHLHYNLQTSGDLDGGDGLPAAFDHVKVNGKHAKNAEPVRGDVVERR